MIRVAQWLNARKVESVAMESTRVYWIAPHEVLEAEGLEVMLVDTRQLARVEEPVPTLSRVGAK